MSERILHHRTKGPASTPAQRLIELQQEIRFLEGRIDGLKSSEQDLKNRLDCFYRMQDVSFGGIQMAQQWADLWMWERVLNDNPQLKAIFEIGTWKGGFSWWLWAQTSARRMHFATYDAIEPERTIPGFSRADVFAEYAPLGITFRAWEPCLVFCDGGNKPRELKTFVEQLEHPESLLVVHDWGTEFTEADVHAGVRMVYGDFCEELGAISRVFQLKENDA